MANQVLYGFHDLQHLRQTKITEAMVPTINTAVRQAVEEHQRQLAAIKEMFVTPIFTHKTAFQIANNARLQPMDEYGRARPIKALGKYDVGYPLFIAGVASGETDIESILQTVGDVEQSTATMLMADINWVRDKILAPLYNNVEWTYTDKQHGDVIVKPLANGDSTKYFVARGAENGETAQHYNFQAADISDAANPFPAIARRLRRQVQNGKTVVALVPENLIDDVENLATFVDIRDSNIRQGANTDELIGNLGVQVPGEIKGYVKGAKVWIVQWDSLEDDRIISIAVGGPTPLAWREYEDARLRGFQFVAERNDYPYKERQYRRVGGAGGWNRVGADVTQIGNSSYTIPTGWDKILKE